MQSERALADVERAMKVETAKYDGPGDARRVVCMEKKYEAALEIFDRMQAQNPNWAPPYFDRGSVLMERGEFAAALEQINRSISLLPQIRYFTSSVPWSTSGWAILDAAHRKPGLQRWHLFRAGRTGHVRCKHDHL